MKIKNKLFIVCCVVTVISMLLTASYFLGCNANQGASSEPTKDNEIIDNNQPTKTDEEIKLSTDNYAQYFDIQEEIISFNSEGYRNYIYSGSTDMTDYTRATQTTKISIIQLREIKSFNNVVISIRCSNSWNSKDATLKLSYNGSGFLTLTASYDDYTSSFYNVPNAHYKIWMIQGSITISQ